MLSWIGERVPSSSLIVVVSELRAVTTRTVALAGIAALAVYGSVAIGGARADLIHGLDSSFSEYLGTAELWVTTGGNDLTTNSFRAEGSIQVLASTPGVASVRVYQGGYLDVGSRRMWVIARPAADSTLIPASQLLRGNLARATQLVRGGGWATVSAAFAEEHRLGVGSAFALPVPAGTAHLRVAAITTNLGWSPGAIILNTSEYRRYWKTSATLRTRGQSRRPESIRPPASERSPMRWPDGRASACRRSTSAGAIRRERATRIERVERDLVAAVDRRRTRGRLSAQRKRLAAACAAGVAEDPGV